MTCDRATFGNCASGPPLKGAVLQSLRGVFPGGGRGGERTVSVPGECSSAHGFH